ncbi:MAG: dienelactone hydrolase family protein [Burkholderiaceae bacterium]
MAAAAIGGALLAALALVAGSAGAAPETVRFPSAQSGTTLVGYLYRPAGDGPFPAAVLLHGRAGPYSSNVSGACTLVDGVSPSPCGAQSLSRRHQAWGEFWARRGVLALLVDSFGPRGLGHGFARGTHGSAQRVPVHEATVRPLDAEGALAWLRARADVRAERIALQGWSNGASTVINLLQRSRSGGGAGFVAALALYPGCGAAAVPVRSLRASAPATVFLGGADEEVSPAACRAFLERADPSGAPVEVVWYDDATHDFDDPGPARQAVAANRRARDDVERRAEAFAREVLGAR